MGLCKLCGEERVLVRSHIIPIAFHRHMQCDSTVAPVVVGSASDSYPMRRPGGLYDEELLCDPCEQRFGPWDQYGAECLLQGFERDAQRMAHNGETLAYQIDDWDQEKIRMFALSLLWRAAATTNPVFRRVTLGPYEERLRQLIVAGVPDSPDNFSVLLCRWHARPENEKMALTQMSPYSWKLEGINMSKLFLGGFVFYIKSDQRAFTHPFPEIMLSLGQPVYAIAQELEDSKDILAMRPALERYAAFLNRR
jgi:hypothetical protein